MAAEPRKIDPALMWRVARTNLGRTACEFMDPTDTGHDHVAICLRDDAAYAADLLLRVLAPAINGEEDLLLDRVTDLLDAMDRDQ